MTTSNPLVRFTRPGHTAAVPSTLSPSGQEHRPGEAAGVPARRAAKSAEAFRTISEVATELDVPQHVLRFWETKFSQIRPLKRGGGRRYYRPDDMVLLRTIHKLLHQDGYTIKGVQRLLKEGGRPGGRAGAADGAARRPGIGAEAEPGRFESGPEDEDDAMLDLFDEAADAVPAPTDFVPLLPFLSSEKRAVLKSVLTELEELRALIPTRISRH